MCKKEINRQNKYSKELEEVDNMTTLQEVREANKRNDMLFVGMEKEPVKLPLEVMVDEREFYENRIKPHACDMLKKHFNKNK